MGKGRVTGCTAGFAGTKKYKGSSGGFAPHTQASAAELHVYMQGYGTCAGILNVTPVGLPPPHTRECSGVTFAAELSCKQ